MLSSNYDMTHMNYKNVKERMSETSKGFWKVQSIHKLTAKLQLRYNPKDFIILKTIKRPPPKIPPFIFFEHEEKFPQKTHQKLENQKNISCGRFTMKNFFITGERNRTIKEEEEKKNTLFNKIYGKFSYEPYLYNEFQFFCLKREKRLLPRRFKDVVKDCIAFREYKNYINNLRKTKDEKIMTSNDFKKNGIHTNDKKSMTVISKKDFSDNEILNNVFGKKNEESNMSYNNIKNINSKRIEKEKSSSSMKNIRNGYKLIKSKMEKNKDRISLPQLNIKKNFKM